MNENEPPPTSTTPETTGDALVIDLAAARQHRTIGHQALPDELHNPSFRAFIGERRNPQKTASLAPVISLEEHTRSADEKLLRNTYTLLLENLKDAEHPNQALEAIEQSLKDIYEVSPDTAREPLAEALLYYLSTCHENYTKLAVGYPELLKLIGVAANISPHATHPAWRMTRNRGLAALSSLPGSYNLETGDYTPPPSVS